MNITLSPSCESLTGSLGSGYGYHIQRRKNGFFVKRNSKGDVPPDGHWRFILACAVLAFHRLHVAEIEVGWLELTCALYEAKHFEAGDYVAWSTRDGSHLKYYAADIIDLKNRFRL